jgi:hypothetical protein
MSNYLEIAAVTSTLSQWLYEKAAKVLDGAGTTIGRPKDGIAKGINIYLYQVTYNPYWQNEDLLRHEIQRRIAADPSDSLAKCELSEQLKSIKITPLSLNLEEMSKLWSVLFQIPYTVSLAYKLSEVFIEADVMPQTALPVQRPDIYVLPFRHPVIDKIAAVGGDNAPISFDSNITLSGCDLKGDTTKVNIGGVEVTLLPTDSTNTITDTQITLSLNSSLFTGKTLHAGIQGVFVMHPVMMGDPKVEHYGFESNTKPMVLCPKIIGTVVSGDNLTLSIKPSVGKTQKVTLLLNEFGVSTGTPHAYSIKAPDNNGITGAGVTETNLITFSVADVTAGKYLLRVQVDGAESPLQVSVDPSDPKYVSPQVNIT